MEDALIRRIEGTDDDDLAHYSDLILSHADLQWALTASEEELKLWAEGEMRLERDAEN